MEKLYPVFFALAILLIANFPFYVSAQCTCSGGAPATAVTYYNTLDTTNASSSTISFPEFDPSIGTLSCVTFIDTISGITTTNVQNTGSTKTQFKFLLTVANNISGPGVDVDDDYTKNYGPDSLNAAGDHPGDSITYGPDNIFNNIMNTTTASSTAPYLGTGSVNFVYTLNGGLIALAGGLNYNSQIITNYWGTFSLTYYWCPVIPLAINIINFTAVKDGKYVQLQWQALNEQSNINYEIESSTDGSHFIAAGNVESNFSNGDSSASSYQYMYPLSNADAGILYFRIKRIDAAGNASYSIVKTVNIEAVAMAGYQVYPNPVTNTVMLDFDEMQTGNFIVSLVNTTGQVIQQKAVTLSGGNQIRLDLNNKPAAGLYFLQAKDQTHNQRYVTKVLIK